VLNEVSVQLAELPRLKPRKLRALWQDLFGGPAHPKIRRDLMIPILAYRLQERAYGGLKPSIRKRLAKLATELVENPKAGLAQTPRIKTGTKLIREWQAQHHEVIVLDGGFEYLGCRYDSLSEIARRITGTRWSGPLFFGLKSQRKARLSQ
jgi:hypothetical protein